MRPLIGAAIVAAALLGLASIDDAPDIQRVSELEYCQRVEAHKTDPVLGHWNYRGYDCDTILAKQ